MSQFTAQVLKPAQANPEFEAFVVLPKAVSDPLPRRGRTSVDVVVNDHGFQVTLEPDGQLSHWFKLLDHDMQKAHLQIGAEYRFQLTAVDQEPEPVVPEDLLEALQQSAEASETWHATTTLARIDWVHWVESAKQAKTRAKRIADACQMLGEGKRRVCCFDPSGFYSKALKAPQA